ncbi:MAG: hypothetical protein WBF58_03440 [Xanthobacteraceae bacterium]
MRLAYLSIALLGIVAGAGLARSALTEAEAHAAIIEPGGSKAAAARATVFGSPHRRGNLIRLAQDKPVAPVVDPQEATSGNPSQPPYKWVGMLLIPNPTQAHPNSLTGCTAQFIAPSVLLTAGHCIKDITTSPTGPWPDPTKGTFWLQYQNNQGTAFKIVCAAANPLWQVPANFNSLNNNDQLAAFLTAMQHDFAMILVNGTSPTGAMPYQLDWKGKFNFAWRVGYPADILGGDIVQRVGGSLFFANAIPMGQWSQPNLVVQWGPITDATHGMSGGAWVANLSTTETANKNVLIAVTSGAPTGPARLGNTQRFPGGTFAAYLTAAEFNPLLSFVSGGCKSPPGSGAQPGPTPKPSPQGPTGGGPVAPNSQ